MSTDVWTLIVFALLIAWGFLSKIGDARETEAEARQTEAEARLLEARAALADGKAPKTEGDVG